MLWFAWLLSNQGYVAGKITVPPVASDCEYPGFSDCLTILFRLPDILAMNLNPVCSLLAKLIKNVLDIIAPLASSRFETSDV